MINDIDPKVFDHTLREPVPTLEECQSLLHRIIYDDLVVKNEYTPYFDRILFFVNGYEEMLEERVLNMHNEMLDETEEVPDTTIDMVNSPPHYKHGGIETTDLIEGMLSPSEFRGYLKGTILAYRERAPYKGTTDLDYDKALWYWMRLKGFYCE